MLNFRHLIQISEKMKRGKKILFEIAVYFMRDYLKPKYFIWKSHYMCFVIISFSPTSNIHFGKVI